MATIKAITEKGEVRLTAAVGDNLYKALIGARVPIDGSCGGHEVCGKCRVEVLEGEVPPPSDNERKHITEADLSHRIRLACMIEVQGDMVVVPIATKGAAQIMVGGVQQGALPTDGEAGFAVGIDIGTTTVAAFLIDLPTGQTIGTKSALNAQRPYGGDVIARCGHALSGPEGKETLARLIRDQIDELIDTLCTDAGADKAQIHRVTLAGNPTMMHLCAGLDVGGIAVAPYLPAYTEGFSMTAGALGITLGADTPVLFLPVISGYVGADTVAAVIASGMDQSDELSLLIDIGTNGEIVLGTKDKLLCCAAAAGPAFEGGKISCGIGGIVGAIDKIFSNYADFAAKKPDKAGTPPADLDGPYYTTIGGQAAKGICGSGLIDLIALLCRKGCIDETGVLSPDDCDDAAYTDRFDDAGRFILAAKANGAASEVSLTQKDVREVQLAKSAIAAGVDILALRLGVELAQIEHVYLAGGFGSFIDYDSACTIGLLSPILRSKIVSIGNAAGSGARMTACSQAERDHAEDVARRMDYIELAEAKEFSDEFMENMIFPV